MRPDGDTKGYSWAKRNAALQMGYGYVERVKLSDTYYDKLMKIMETHDFSKEEAIERLIDSFENKPDT